MIPRAAVGGLARPERRLRDDGLDDLDPVGLGVLQRLDEIGEPLLDGVDAKFFHHRFPAHPPLGQRHRQRGRNASAPCRRYRAD